MTIEEIYQGKDDVELDRNHSLFVKDIKTLRKTNWLNDVVVNAYMELICKAEDATCLNSHLYPKLRKKGEDAASLEKWQKNVDLFAKRFIIVPVFLSAHWTLLLVDNKEKKILYFDSYHNTTENFWYKFEPWLKKQWIRRKPKEKYEEYAGIRVLVR